MDWKELEAHVRDLASCHWAAKAIPETINGVRFDCVVKHKPDYWIIIEVSKEENLDKLRVDIAKFASVRLHLMSEGTYSECYFVCNNPSEQMRITGEGNKVNVISVDQLRGLLLGYDSYFNLRSKKSFGSAVDRQSGTLDKSEYVSVKYSSADGKHSYSVSDISELLRRGEKIILLGDFGTGKSRCIQETFFAMREEVVNHWQFPIAIDLRENWGVQTGYEMLRRHFNDLGASEMGESTLRLLNSKRIILLIDGFDEVASQTWSNDPVRLRDIRRRSLAAIRDLFNRVNCGILITGREHYFNSMEEMFDCVGLKEAGTHVLTCSQEFTEAQVQSYLLRLNCNMTVPTWLPKRPLICQILSDLDIKVLSNLVNQDVGEIRFWEETLVAVCEREAKINSILDARVIQDVLTGLARLTRIKPRDFGPISTSEINDVFKNVTGVPPSDESAVILQRLPFLGRVEAHSPDRQFVDIYFLDGLRAEDVCAEVFQQDESILSEIWHNPLRPFGIRVLSHEISLSPSKTDFVRFLRKACTGLNRVLGGDLVAAILGAHDGTFAFGGITLSETLISSLDISGSNLSGINITHSIIDEIVITGAHPSDVLIKDCQIGKVDGVSEATGLPTWMVQNKVGDYVRLNTVTRIKQAKLSLEQMVFVTIIKKTFFQPGSGRMENALLRGLGAPELNRSSEKILKMLCREGILEKAPGKEGLLYIPKRTHMNRMADILKELTLSKDVLWKQLKSTD